MGRGWLVGPAELGVVHGAEERGERVEQRLGADRGQRKGKELTSGAGLAAARGGRG